MSAQPAEGSTGTATIGFTNLVASTTWRAQLGDERAEAREVDRFERLSARLTA